MFKYLWPLLIATSPLCAQVVHPPDIVATDLPACSAASAREGRILSIVDASSTSDCTSGGGGDITAICACVEDPDNTYTWTAIGGAGSTNSISEGDSDVTVTDVGTGDTTITIDSVIVAKAEVAKFSLFEGAADFNIGAAATQVHIGILDADDVGFFIEGAGSQTADLFRIDGDGDGFGTDGDDDLYVAAGGFLHLLDGTQDGAAFKWTTGTNSEWIGVQYGALQYGRLSPDQTEGTLYNGGIFTTRSSGSLQNGMRRAEPGTGVCIFCVASPTGAGDSGVGGTEALTELLHNSAVVVSWDSLVVNFYNTLIQVPRSSAPTCTAGASYYDSDDDDFCDCVGAVPAWRSRGGAGACT